MIWNLEDIQKMRKQEGITQSELAKLSGVSQSMIAKIESGKLDPGFSSTKKIFFALETRKAKKMILAKDVMSKHIETINVNESIEMAVKLMKKKNYSQILVRKDNNIVGLVTEKGLLEAFVGRKSKISEIMEASPPSVSSETPLKPVVDLLHYFSIVMVQADGKPIGVITKSDVLGKNF